MPLAHAHLGEAVLPIGELVVAILAVIHTIAVAIDGVIDDPTAVVVQAVAGLEVAGKVGRVPIVAVIRPTHPVSIGVVPIPLFPGRHHAAGQQHQGGEGESSLLPENAWRDAHHGT